MHNKMVTITNEMFYNKYSFISRNDSKVALETRGKERVNPSIKLGSKTCFSRFDQKLYD